MFASGQLRSTLSLVAVLLIGTRRFDAQSGAADVLAHAFARAWNAHDVEAFRQMYADDAEWITVAGVRHKGQLAIVAALAKEQAGWARSTTIRVSNVTVREPQIDHSVVTFSWEISDESRADARPVRGTTLLVTSRKDGRWIIVAGQASAALSAK